MLTPFCHLFHPCPSLGDTGDTRPLIKTQGLGQLGINLCTPLFDEGGHTLLMLAAEQGWTQLLLWQKSRSTVGR